MGLTAARDNAYAARMSTPLPVIDVSRQPAVVARDIDAACRDLGFFYAVGHGIAPRLTTDLIAAAWRFFGAPVDAKRRIAMAAAADNRR